jgi:membrane-associated phospholipid phosphatase
MNRDLLLWQIIRASPIIYPIIFSFMYLQDTSLVNLFLLISYMVNLSLNWVFKFIMSSIYNIYGKKTLPILGLGFRPNGAINCGVFFPLKSKIANTFGMPSGHSQSAWFVTTFLILYMMKKHNIKSIKDIKNIKKIDSKKYNYIISYIIILILISLTISLSRVLIENCHTFQQITIGGILGIILGAISFKIYEHISNH